MSVAALGYLLCETCQKRGKRVILLRWDKGRYYVFAESHHYTLTFGGDSLEIVCRPCGTTTVVTLDSVV